VTGVNDSLELDLRGTPVWERPAKMLDLLDGLPGGASVTVLTEHEPRGLSARLTQKFDGLIVGEMRWVGDGLYHLRFTRQTSRNANATIDALGRCAPFAPLDAAAREELAAGATVESARRGEVLVPESTDWPFIGVVTEGVAALSGGPPTRERVLYEIFQYELFGVAELFDRGLTIGRVVAFSKSVRVLKLPREAVLAAAKRCPELWITLGATIAQRQRLLADALTVQGTLPILGRIARVLLPYAMADRGLAPAVASLSSITQAQIAAAAGTVKEVAARAIAELEARELLRRERGHIRYLDRTRLLEFIREFS